MEVEFFEAIKFLPDQIKNLLTSIPENIKENAQEIRLRAGRKICIVKNDNTYYIEKILEVEEIKECFRAICGYSIHSHTAEIAQGFVTLIGGHRAGLSGKAVYDEKGTIINLRDISSINIRIARQVEGIASELLKKLNGNVEKLLIVGPPSSGKTTLLKDIVRNITKKQVSVIDSRGEIAACLNGVPQTNLGNADVFDCWNRSDGILAAIKTMSPEIIVCDEIGSEEDVEAIKSCVGAGVYLIASAHGANFEEIKNRKIIKEILETKAFEYLAFLEGRNKPGKIKSIAKVGEIVEADWNNYSSALPCNNGNFIFN